MEAFIEAVTHVLGPALGNDVGPLERAARHFSKRIVIAASESIDQG
jgi:hypothetical protein